MFWKTEDKDSALPLQDVPASADRKKYAALENIDQRETEKSAPAESAHSGIVVQRRGFASSNIVISRAKVLTASGRAEKPPFRPNPGLAGVLLAKTTGFKLTARFSNYSTGFYNVRWRLKLLEGLCVSNGLHFTVDVSYGAEPDVSGTFDVLMPSEILTNLAKDQWYNLELEEKLVIQPHEGEAQVKVALSNNDIESSGEYSGIIIDHVEIRPILTDLNIEADIPTIIVERAGKPKFSIDPLEARPDAQNGWPCDLSQAPITRLSVSKASRFLASLAVSKDIAVITVWDMSLIKNQNKPSPADLAPVRRAAVAVVRHPGIGDLAIGLAISTNGDQVAVYQEPKIGEWVDGSEVTKASFPFKIYNNPLVPQPTVVLNLGESSNSNADNVDTSATPPNTVALQEVSWKHDVLDSFIGYGAFLPVSTKGDWEKNDLNSALFGNPENMDSDGSGDSLVEDEDSSAPRSMFAACNGLYLDVFEISSENVWRRLHTITLTDLLPTLTRRITCKMMMESISSNTFMWLEDNGLCCAIWNVMNGSTISYISSLENARFKGPTFRGHSKMAISPHESIVALASIDGSVTTYFANTGMAIDERPFPGFKIEYVGFHGQDNYVFVILRNSTTSELSSRILDTFQLKSETLVNNGPIPTIGSTVLAFFSTKGFWGRGVICEADGPKINCYISHQEKSPKVNKFSPTVIKAEYEDVSHESLFDKDISYQLRTGFHREPLPEGDGMSYWVLRVEVVEENKAFGTQNIIFSFIPEPWMRITVGDVRDPGTLLRAYFTPGGLRFAVIGVQTLQLWNLPTNDNPKCTLEYFWSHPKEKANLLEKATRRSMDVRDYYADIAFASIYMEAENGNAAAEIKTSEKGKRKMVYIPGTDSDSGRHTVLFCFRSIHLLAAAYAFSRGESRKSARDIPQVTLTYEEHADAILRFTRAHINRMLSYGLYSPRSAVPQQSIQATQNSTVGDSANSNTRPSVVTILTLLLDEPQLKSTNHVFVEGLLQTEYGEWKPRDNKALNPIKRAIDSKDAHLVEAFIDYCIRNAKKHHPAYMTPAIQCLNELSDRYPNILTDMFRKASYVPAHNHAYVSSHAIVANRRYGDYLNFFANYYSFRLWRGTLFKKSNNINDYEKPVFSLRCQLPFRAVSSFNILSIETSVIERRSEYFPEKQEYVDEEQKRMQSTYSHKIYVCPFPKLSSFGPYRAWHTESAKSAFFDIAGQDFFDSPAMIATLQFKWHKYGFFNWFLRFFIALSFFIFMVVITAWQIKVCTLPDPNSPDYVPVSDSDIQNRYMDGWRPFMKFTIFVGFLLIIYDIQRLEQNPRKFVGSPFNFVHLIAHVLPIAGLFYFLDTKPGPKKTGDPDGGPSQIWVMSFAILALYMNLLFELRVIRQLGIVVNIIINITRRIAWLFTIFGLFIVSFTHALLHLLHTRSYKPECIDATNANATITNATITSRTCHDKDYPDGYPTDFLGALSATYFFLAGRYDPVSTSFDNGTASFHVMMVIFFFFTTVLLLNILIALMNDAFNESSNQGQLAWLKQWSEVITDVESSYLSNGSRQNRNFFPDYIYYGANEKEAEAYESQFFISNKSNLSIENRYVIDTVSTEQSATHLTQRAILKDVQNLEKDLEKVDKNQEEVTQEINKVKSLVQQTQSDLAQELAEMKKLVSYLVAHAGGIAPGSQVAAPTPVMQSPASTSTAVVNPPEIPPTSTIAPGDQVDAPAPVMQSPKIPPISTSRPLPHHAKTSYFQEPMVESPSTMPHVRSDIIELGNPLRSKTSYTMLRQRLQERLATTRTGDDNNVSNPHYVKPTRRHSSVDCTSDLDDSDDESEAQPTSP
ncbi:hypothetical protein BGX26_005947 [Mortierella sp. AD094]|nr:hypothetical protein BGX26_005947 [Mortierella sp. AD094]